METTAYAAQDFQIVPRWMVLAISLVSLLIIGLWTLATPETVHGKADAVGYAICHRIPERSFFAFGRQLPLCARCTGIYLGAMTAFLTFIFSGRGKASGLPHWKIGLVLAGFVGVLGVDGINSYFHLFPGFEYGLYEPNNTLRLITGMYTGLAMVTLVLPIFNNITWRKDNPSRIINGWRELGGMLLVVSLVLAATLTRRPLILLAFGFLSTLGVVLMLTLINSVMVITFLRTERHYNSLQDLWLPVLGGVAMTLVVIGLIDLARYSITGTWDGFSFPTAMIWWKGA